jgi:hypothetical protein
MSVDEYELRYTPAGGRARLGELDGFRERSVRDTSTATAVRLLGELLGADGAGGVVSAEELTAADRDRLLALVYRRAYGDRVESTVDCVRCESKFDLNFDLRELTESLDSQPPPDWVEALGDGTYRLPDGRRFRLPSGRDECEVAALPAEEAVPALVARCLIEEGEAAGDGRDAVVLQEALERIAPVLDLNLDARCPECGHAQAVHFDVQSYLLGALINERRQLAAEVHRLASSYGWALGDILSLGRAERRTYVSLIESDMARARRRIYA